uniref:Uncharacterized protein n=1 Tax=Anguilla anguilla TaxID=7936 RepID=A0A0E9XGK2_ANGAN
MLRGGHSTAVRRNVRFPSGLAMEFISHCNQQLYPFRAWILKSGPRIQIQPWFLSLLVINIETDSFMPFRCEIKYMCLDCA